MREGELSQLSRRVAEREDEMMWAEFQERFFYNLGLVRRGGGLTGLLRVFEGRGRNRLQEQGWSASSTTWGW